MKSRTLVLALSLTANLALLGAVTLRPAAATAFFRAFFVGSDGAETHKPATPANPAASATPGTVNLAWNATELADLPALVQQLRAAGFPPGVVRAFVTAVVAEKFAARRRDAQRDQMPGEFWKNGYRSGTRMVELEAAMREINRDQQRTLREALGADYYRRGDEVWGDLARQREFGPIPQAKIDQYRKIVADYEEMMQRVQEDGMGITLPEDRAKLELLRKEQRADIEKLFTPEELAEFDIRNSSVSHYVRSRLGRFEATEEEFRALYAAQKTFEESHARFDRNLPPGQRDKVEPLFRSVLGEERFAAFKAANDPAADPGPTDFLARLVTRLNLPVENAPAISAVQRDIMQRATAARTNASLTPAERIAQVEALAAEATAKLTPLLGGPKGLETYRTNGGNWLQGMIRAPGGRGATGN